MLRKTAIDKKEPICPIIKAANLLGDSFILIIVRDLFFGPRRFSDFVSSLEGTSTRTVSKKLKYLEQEGIVARKVVSKQPPHVSYTLTPKGRGLKPLVSALLNYGKKHLSNNHGT